MNRKSWAAATANTDPAAHDAPEAALAAAITFPINKEAGLSS